MELSEKQFDRPYPLTLRYETRFGMKDGDIRIEPVKPLDGHLFRGNIAIRTTDKVELTATKLSPSLQPDDARNLDTAFGAGSLADAVFFYRCTGAAYDLALHANRHEAADLLEAEVKKTVVSSVANSRGQTINRVELHLRVGSRCTLAAKLPAGSSVWSLLINGLAVNPSINNGTYLIPLASGANTGEREVTMELTYVTDREPAWAVTHPSFVGPRFDLPLRNIEWILYLPEGYTYDDFTGTMAFDERQLDHPTLSRYNLRTYEQQILNEVSGRNSVAQSLQRKARRLLQQGNQWGAREALTNAYYNSFQQADLNEDMRVQLHALNKQQAMVGLKARRATLRPQQFGGSSGTDLGLNYTEEEARRALSALDKADSENLEQISSRIMRSQEAAAGNAPPLTLHLPTQGRKLVLTRSLQVEPFSAMEVRCAATSKAPGLLSAWLPVSALFFGLFLLILSLAPSLTRTGATAGREEKEEALEEPAAEEIEER